MKPIFEYLLSKTKNTHIGDYSIELVDQHDINFKGCHYESFSEKSFGFVYTVKDLMNILGKPVRPDKNEYEWYCHSRGYNLYFYIKAEYSSFTSARTQKDFRKFKIFCKPGEEEQVADLLDNIGIKTGFRTFPYNK